MLVPELSTPSLRNLHTYPLLREIVHLLSTPTLYIMLFSPFSYHAAFSYFPVSLQPVLFNPSFPTLPLFFSLLIHPAARRSGLSFPQSCRVKSSQVFFICTARLKTPKVDPKCFTIVAEGLEMHQIKRVIPKARTEMENQLKKQKKR